MVKADFVTGLVLIALGIATVVASLRMPRFEELEINPYTAPGLVPGALGLVILILGAALFVRAARAGGWRLTDRAAGSLLHPCFPREGRDREPVLDPPR